MKLLISWFEKKNRGFSVPRWYQYSYTDFARAYDVYYPLPLNYIVRYWLGFYWYSLRAIYWVGLIDTGENECFSWGDFFRIKSH